MSPAGFEPALPGETDLKSVALDHSAMVTKGDVIYSLTQRLLLLPGIEPGSLGETDPMDYHFPSVARYHLKGLIQRP